MNYLLETTSLPDYPVKFGKNNPNVDNALDLGNYINPANINGPLHYVDASNGNIPWHILSQYDALTSVSGGLLVSRKITDLINFHFPHEVQLLEADIEYQGKLLTGFSVLNVYTKLPCYDLESSIYEQNPVDHSFDFEKIVLSDASLEEYDIEYQIVRSFHDNRIVVSESFKRVMEENQVNAFEFAGTFVAEW